MTENGSKRSQLERLFRKYPDVPKEVIIKEDMLRNGQAFSEAALRAGEGRRTKQYGGYVFSWDLVNPDDMKQQEVFRVPDVLEMRGGLYNLRGRLRVRCRVNPKSPYIVDVVEGKLVVGEREGTKTVPIAELYEYPPIPNYWSKSFEDGTPYREVCRADAHPIVLLMCTHWARNEQCKYCDINENWRMTKSRGACSLKKPYLKPEQVAEVINEIFHEKRDPADRPLGVFIDGGAIIGKLAGLKEVDFYLRYVVAIREKIGNRWPLALATAPKQKQIAKRFRDLGVDIHATNMEVWDPKLFEIICPGKARVVGRDNWLKWMLEEVDIFGEGNVVPAFVVGVEMSQPWGFRDIKEAVKSTTDGFEYLMSHGVTPRPVTWCVEPGSALRGQEVPSIEYLIEIDRKWYELITKYRLPPPSMAMFPCRMGPGRWEYPNNAAGDMCDQLEV